MLDKTQLDPLTYRDAMSRLAGHVHIVTAAHAGVRRGVTITAACSVSDDPATLPRLPQWRQPAQRHLYRERQLRPQSFGCRPDGSCPCVFRQEPRRSLGALFPRNLECFENRRADPGRGGRGLRLPVDRYQDGCHTYRSVRRGCRCYPRPSRSRRWFISTGTTAPYRLCCIGPAAVSQQEIGNARYRSADVCRRMACRRT